MRISVTIDDQVLREARQRAASEGRALDDLITDALRSALRPNADAKPYEVLTYGSGGPRPGMDITNNAAVRDAMDEI